MEEEGVPPPKRTRRAKRSCLTCSRLKKKCEYLSDDDACLRCLRLGGACVPEASGVPRRKREQQRRRRDEDDSEDSEEPSEEENEEDEGSRAPSGGKASPAAKPDPLPAAVVARPALRPPSDDFAWAGAAYSPGGGFFSSPNPLFSASGPPFASPPATAGTALAAVPRPLAAPGANASSIEDALRLAVDAYWTHVHPQGPMVHRGAVEQALLGTTGSVFGPGKPLALFFALAANGSRFVSAWGPSPDDARHGRLFCERARDALRAGYFDRPPGSRAMSDLEAILTIILLFSYLMPAGNVPTVAHMFRPGLQVLLRVCAAPGAPGAGTSLVRSQSDPATADEWLRTEMALRCWMSFAGLDAEYSYYVGRNALYPYFSHPLPLPASEFFFDHANPADGFSLWRIQQASDGRAFLDLSATADWTPMGEQARRAVAAVCSRRASITVLPFVGWFMRHLRSRLRTLAAASDLDLVALASQPPASDTPAQAAYRSGAAALDGIARSCFAGLPADLAPLARGEPEPVLAGWQAYLPREPHAHALLAHLFVARCMPMENWLSGHLEFSRPEFAATQAYRDVLEAAVVCLRIARALLLAEPGLPWTPYAVFPGLLNIGLLGLSALVVLPRGQGVAEGWAEDVRVVSGCLDALGARFKPLASAVAGAFRRKMAEAGVAMNAIAAGDGEDGGLGGLPAQEGELLVLERWLKPWVV